MVLSNCFRGMDGDPQGLSMVYDDPEGVSVLTAAHIYLHRFVHTLKICRPTECLSMLLWHLLMSLNCRDTHSFINSLLFYCLFPDHSLTGNGYLGDQPSLRSRQASSRASNQNHPQFNWSSTPAEKDEEDGGGPPRDLRSSPLPMALKRAVRYETCLFWQGSSLDMFHFIKYALKCNLISTLICIRAWPKLDTNIREQEIPIWIFWLIHNFFAVITHQTLYHLKWHQCTDTINLTTMDNTYTDTNISVIGQYQPIISANPYI